MRAVLLNVDGPRWGSDGLTQFHFLAAEVVCMGWRQGDKAAHPDCFSIKASAAPDARITN